MPAKPSSFTFAEIKAGVLLLASAAVFALFFVVIRGGSGPENPALYHASFHDTQGLNIGADVHFGGFKVGRVSAIGLDPDDQSQVRVTAEIRPDVPVNASSEASIAQVTLTSQRHLEISTGEPGAERLAAGAAIPTRSRDIFALAGEVAEKVSRTLDGVEKMLGADQYARKAEGDEKPVSIPDILANLHDGIGDFRGLVNNNAESVRGILERVREIEDSVHALVENIGGLVAENREGVRSAVAGANSALTGVDETVREAGAVVADVRAAAARLQTMVDTLQATLENTEQFTAEAGNLVSDNRADIQDLIRDLRQVAVYLQAFARQIAEQPQSVLRGAEPAGRRAP
jgi:phospholipid/cholesterol/gamma-HCH transport system substrate-binding protein